MKSRNETCAIYARYSSLDALTSDGVSRSIMNQIRILTDYATKNGFEIYKVYQDYHESGKDFNRPEFKELFDDAKNNKFGIVLIKDLSRFGRNYIEVGNFIDQVFPAHNLRLISVNDNLDTDKSSDSLTIAIKNFMNDYYIKDIGKKIRKSFSINVEKESMVRTHYGYKIRNKKVTVYEPEAKIVRSIFEMYNSGVSVNEIRDKLIKDKVPTIRIAYYLKFNDMEKYNSYPEEERYKWKSSRIESILEDEYYTGVAINGKTPMKSSSIRNLRFEEEHEAIIPKEAFDSIDRRAFHNANVQYSRDNLKGMVLCNKCLAIHENNPTMAAMYVSSKDGKAMYFDGLCKRHYDGSLMNKRIYDELIRKYNSIKTNKEEYIKNLVIDLNSVNGDALRISRKKTEDQRKLTKLFDKYMAGDIDGTNYKRMAKALNDEILKAENYLKGISFDDFTVTDVTNRVNRFLNLFYESENIVEVIKSNVYKTVYDSKNGKIEIILNLEHELDVPSKRLSNIVNPLKIRRSDFDIDKLLLDIIYDYPCLKIKALTSKLRETWVGFTYTMVKKSLERLIKDGKVKRNGDSKLVDGYVVTSYKDSFDYGNLELKISEKEVYKALYENPKLSYTDLAAIICVTPSRVRDIIISLRRKGAFDDTKHFDRSFIPEGSKGSIFEDLKSNYDEKEVLAYIAEHPKLSRVKLAAALNITEAQARRMLEIYKSKKKGGDIA